MPTGGAQPGLCAEPQPGFLERPVRHEKRLPACADTGDPSPAQQHPWWSAFWDKEYAVWRVAEDDPDSALYAESADAAELLSYMAAHS